MIFKNNRGEVTGYVIGLIIALIILLISVGVFVKIKKAQKDVGDQGNNACTIIEGTCRDPTEGGCPPGSTRLFAPCAGSQICCKSSS
jgi:hypothetical protein